MVFCNIGNHARVERSGKIHKLKARQLGNDKGIFLGARRKIDHRLADIAAKAKAAVALKK